MRTNRKKNACQRTALATALALSVSFTGCSNESENASSDAGKAVGTSTENSTVNYTSMQAAKKSASADPDAKNEKEETVYGILNADGSLNHTIISNWLKNFEGSSSLTVASNLTDVKNVNGDEPFTKDADGLLVWDAQGNDIYYQGSNSDELPVSLKIIYKLDGKEISPEELAGKSGKVTIRYEYKNNTKNTITVNGKEESVSTPFTVITGMVLPTETFTNVEVENARILSDGSSQIAVGCAFPGLQKSLGITDKDLKEISDDFTIPDYIEITADVENFSMDMTLSIVSSRIFAEMKDDFDKKIDDLDDLSKDMDNLADGMKELKDGADDLKDGASDLKDGAKELNDGASDLKDGAGDLNDGASDLKDGVKELNDGASDLKDGAGDLKDGTKDLKDGAKELKNGAKTLKDGLSTLNQKASDMTDGVSALKKGVKQYTDGVSALKEGAGTLQAAYEGEQGAVAGAAALAQGTQTLYDTVTNFSLDTAALAIDVDIDTSSLIDEKAILADCTDAATQYIKEHKIDVTTPEGQAVLQAFQAGCTAGTGAVSKNLQKAFASQKDSVAKAVSAQIKQQIGSTLDNVMTQMGSAAKQLNDGAGALSTGVKQLYAGTKQVNEGIAALHENSAALNEGAKTLKSGWSQYAEGVAAADSGASELFSGTKTLAKGTVTLDDGAGKLQKGTKDLKDGTVKLFDGTKDLKDGTVKLLDGTKDLKDGTVELYDGTKKLYDGTVDLKDGVKTLDEDAIQKILDLFGEEMDEYKDRLRGLFRSAKQYDSFSGSMDDVENSVKFILKTAEISNEEE